MDCKSKLKKLLVVSVMRLVAQRNSEHDKERNKTVGV
jgi:hypothetical protein